MEEQKAVDKYRSEHCVQLQQVTKYENLRRDDEEVGTRMGIVITAFINLERVLRDRKMKLKLRIKVLKYYV